MKRIVFLCTILLCGTVLRAIAQGVEFRDLTFQEALEEAAREEKWVFMDCYTSWCGPCQNMLKNVFTLPEAGEFMNRTFVCVKYDMEKGEGIELQKRFGVSAFPTFFIICPDGTVQHILVGGSQWEHFKERIERGMNEKTSLVYLDERYKKGKLAVKEYGAYVMALRDASRDQDAEEICLEAFRQLNDRLRYHKENWFIYNQEMSHADERFTYLIEHKLDFDQQVGKEEVDAQLYSVYSSILNNLHGEKNGDWVKTVGIIAGQLSRISFDKKLEIESLLSYVVALHSRDIEGILSILENSWEELPLYVTLDCINVLAFVIESGNKEQGERFLALEKKMEDRMENPQMKELIRRIFDNYHRALQARMAYTEVKGTVTRDKMDEINLYEIVNGQKHLIAKSDVGKDGLYGFVFQPAYNGFYLVGGEKNLDRIRLFLKPGDKAEVDITEDSLLITDRNTSANRLLARWEALITPLRERVESMEFVLFDYRDFFPYFMEFLPKAREFQEKISSKDEAFVELLKKTVDYDLDYCAFCILNALKATKELHMSDGRLAHIPSRPSPEDYPVYYDSIVSKEKLLDASVLCQPYGYDYLQRYTTFACPDKGKASLSDRLEWLPCDLLKAEIVLWYAESAKTYEAYMDIVRKYGKYLTTDNHRKRMDAVSARLYKGEKGKEAADFTYPDRNGKMVSLSDFKGKVVLVDVWATWCGPCRKEVPYLVKLEKEMEDEDVVFIGVSVDEKKDHQKWLDVLDKEGLKGIQLFADGWSQIMKDYKIKGIPRFMVFDKDGKVVTINAPRPSNPELKKLLERTLKL